MITLHALVSAAPFDEETKKVVLEKIVKGELDENQKLQMSELCWNMITKLYQTELQLKFDSMLMESAEGKKSYTQHDFAEEQVKLIHDFAAKLEAAASTEAIEEVKKQISNHTPVSTKSPLS